MTIEDIKSFNGHEVTDDQLKEIEESEFVSDVENYGENSIYPVLDWYIITLIDGQEINVFA